MIRIPGHASGAGWRLIAIGLVAAAAFGCNVTPNSVIASADLATITILPAPGAPLSKPETEIAIEVISARLKTLGVTNFSLGAGNEITVSIAAGPGLQGLQRAARANGVLGVVLQPAAAAAPSIGSVFAGAPPLWTGDEVQSAKAHADAGGATVIDVVLTPVGTQLLSAATAAHVGDRLLITLDARVLAAPVIAAAIPDGAFTLTADPSWPLPADALAAVLESGPLPPGWRQP